jgi:hypothetical protein
MKKLLEILVLGLLLIKPAFGAGKKVDQKKRQNIKNRSCRSNWTYGNRNKYSKDEVEVCQ